SCCFLSLVVCRHVPASGRALVAGVGPTARAQTPIDDLGLVDAEAVIVGGVQAGRTAHGTVDVDRHPAGATNEVVVVVVDPILVAGGGTGRLDAPDQPLLGERAQGVVHRLAGYRPDVGPHHRFDVVGGGVGPARDCPHDRQTLRRHPHTVLAEEPGGIGGDVWSHARTMSPNL